MFFIHIRRLELYPRGDSDTRGMVAVGLTRVSTNIALPPVTVKFELTLLNKEQEVLKSLRVTVDKFEATRTCVSDKITFYYSSTIVKKKSFGNHKDEGSFRTTIY